MPSEKDPESTRRNDGSSSKKQGGDSPRFLPAAIPRDQFRPNLITSQGSRVNLAPLSPIQTDALSLSTSNQDKTLAVMPKSTSSMAAADIHAIPDAEPEEKIYLREYRKNDSQKALCNFKLSKLPNATVKEKQSFMQYKAE